MNILEHLTWRTPDRNSPTKSKYDVTISRGAKKTSINIVFRNGVHELIAPKTERIQYAFAFGRLFFKEAEIGWRMSKGNKSADSTRYVRIYFKNEAECESLIEMIGDYDLSQDEGIYCVRKAEKK